MNIPPKPVLSRSLQIEEIPIVGSRWLLKNINDIVYIKGVEVLDGKLYLKYNFINSTHSIYEIMSKLKFHKLFKRINDYYY